MISSLDWRPPLGPISLTSFNDEQSATIEELKRLDPIATAAMFGSLLLVPHLQANSLRLQILVHLALAHGQGTDQPTLEFVRGAFERMSEGYCGRAEDPIEDMFVSNVSTRRGNFRILQGIRESPAFWLQCILNVIDTMPNEERFAAIRRAVEALLTLSEAVHERAGLREATVGRELPADTITDEVAAEAPRLEPCLRFSDSDLRAINVSRSDLAPFSTPAGAPLPDAAMNWGHSTIERRPLIDSGDSLVLLLPTAMAGAVTRFVVEQVEALDVVLPFERKFRRDLAVTLSRTPVLGDRVLARLPFEDADGGSLSFFGGEVDVGRFVLVTLFVDGVAKFTEGGLSGVNPNAEGVGNRISYQLGRMAEEFCDPQRFVEGFLLIVFAGLGRNVAVEFLKTPPPGWMVETISAPDLVTLVHMPGLSWSALLSIVDAQRRLEELGLEFFNVSGLLNLVAWAEALDGHLVPQGAEPSTPGQSGVVWVQQNLLLRPRREYQMQYAARRVLDTDGELVLVQKGGPSYFPEDDLAPFFVSLDDLERQRLKGVYLSETRSWWLQIDAAEGSPAAAIYDYWRMLKTWLCRFVPVVESELPVLPDGALLFDVRFGHLFISREKQDKTLSDEEIRSFVAVDSRPGARQITITIADGFEEGLMRADNFAERLIVEAMVRGAAVLIGQATEERIGSLVKRICPGADARHIHVFEEPTFRDCLSSRLSAKPILIDRYVAAASRIGLAWKARGRAIVNEYSGAPECVAFLNGTVDKLLAELSASLKRFGSVEFCTRVLLNYERAAYDREQWRRTARSNLALHTDQTETMSVIVGRESELNACFIASRILLEAAVCECSSTGSGIPGELDIAEALATASLIFHLGGWSDGIWWGAIEPQLRISASGDIQLDHRFYRTVVEPFGRLGSAARINDAVEEYAEYYHERPVVADTSAVFDGEFLTAWQREFGLAFDEMRAFLDRIEDLARTRDTPVLTLRRSELLSLLACGNNLGIGGAEAALSVICLVPRRNWCEPPEGFQARDCHPWRFRQRLSVLRRPILQVDIGSDPLMLVTPGLVREAFLYTGSSLHSGEVPEMQVRSREMRRWLGRAHHRHGTAFTAEVAARLRELGWEVQIEVRVTKILGMSLTRDFGDIDVLAWKRNSGRVLLIECKDLQYRKTVGEIAEQLADYRGELRRDGTPDDLRKHLDRVAVLEAYPERMAKYLKLDTTNTYEGGGAAKIEGHLVFRHPVPMRFGGNTWRKRSIYPSLPICQRCRRRK
jgi:hypothetical protein